MEAHTGFQASELIDAAFENMCIFNKQIVSRFIGSYVGLWQVLMQPVAAHFTFGIINLAF